MENERFDLHAKKVIKTYTEENEIEILKKGDYNEGLVKEKIQDHNRRVINMKRQKAKDGWITENFRIIAQGYVEALTMAKCGDLDNGRQVDPRPLYFNVIVPQILPPSNAGYFVVPSLKCNLVGQAERMNGQPGFEVCIAMKDAAAFLEKVFPIFTGKELSCDIWELTSIPKV